jgi:hypothetical protein
MSRTWLSIRVDLIEGCGEHLWPRPGRTFAASRTHTFAQLADAIDDAFARWDRSHLHEFELADVRLSTPYAHDDRQGPWLDDRRVPTEPKWVRGLPGPPCQLPRAGTAGGRRPPRVTIGLRRKARMEVAGRPSCAPCG